MFEKEIEEAESVVIKSSQEISDGQRSDAWFEARKGRWTGSQLKNLMSKGRGSALWGATAKEYMFSRFMERLRGTCDTPIKSTFDMRRGEELEPYSIAAFEKAYPQFRVEEADFVLFDGSTTAGASPDGKVVDAKTGKVVAGFETKSRGDKGTYNHSFERVHEKHPDFWQLQGEMIALKVDILYYCHYSDLHEAPFDLQVQVVQKSNDHCLSLMERIGEADSVVDAALQMVGKIEKLTNHELTEKISEARDFIYSR